MTEPTYYVYDLVDPRDGRVFYVGKGKGNRLHHHVREAVNGKRSAKCARIREIRAEGLSHDAVIVSRYWDEQEALDAEASRIAEIGLHNLTNIMPNGWCYVPGTTLIMRDIPKECRKVIAQSGRKVGAIAALHAAGLRFKLGSFDITEAVAAFLNGLRENASAEFSECAAHYEVASA